VGPVRVTVCAVITCLSPAKTAEPIKNLRCNAVWGSGSMC